MDAVRVSCTVQTVQDQAQYSLHSGEKSEMPQRIVPKTLFLSLTFFVCVVTSAQNQPSLGDVARQAKAAKSTQPKKDAKVITNDDMCEQTADTKVGAGTEEPETAAFLTRIAGPWTVVLPSKTRHLS